MVKVILVTGAAQNWSVSHYVLLKRAPGYCLADLKADKLSDVAKEIGSVRRKVTTFAADIRQP